MNISKISSYLFSQGSASKNEKVGEKNSSSESVAAQNSKDEAVKVSSEFRLDSSADRAQKIADIKKQVSSGVYRVPTEQLASKLDQELFG